MKNLRKKMYLFGIGIVTMLIALIVAGNKLTVSAAPSSFLVEYKFYDQAAYAAHESELAYWSGWNTDFERWLRKAVDSDCIDDADDYNGDGVFDMQDIFEYMDDEGLTFSQVMTGISTADTNWAKHKANGNATWQATNSTDPKISCYEYYGSKNPSDILGSDYTGSVTITPLNEKTEFKGGDEIIIEPWVTVYGDTQNGAYIYFDHRDFADSSVTPTFKTISGTDNPSGKIQASMCLIGWGYNADNLTGHTVAAGESTPAGQVYLKLKSDLAAGTYDVSISSVTAGSLRGNTLIFSGASNTSYNYNAASSMFNETAGQIVIEGSGDATNLKTATINGTLINATSTPTITDATSGTATGVTAASSVNVSATVAGGGTVTGVKFGTTSTDVSNSAVDHTATTGTWDCDISDDTKFKPGDSIYITVYTQSGDTTKTGSYVLIVEKAKLSTAILENAVITYDGTTVPSTEFTFSSSTTSYTMKVPKNAEVKVTPTYDQATNYYQTCYVNGASASTASDVEVTIGTTQASFTIQMKAQNGTPKTYTFNLTRIDDDTELTKLEYSVAGSSTKTTIALSGTDYNVTSGILYAKTGFTIYPTLKTGQTVTIEETAGSPVNVTATGKAYTFTNNATDVYAATTKTLTMKVKSAFGSIETYTINITRDKADETVTFSKITITYTASGSTKTKDVSAPTAGVYEITGVPYGVTNYTIKVTLDSSKGSLQQWSLDGGSTKLANNAVSSSINFSTAKTQVTDTQTITVLAENRNITDNYTLKVVRDGADNDTSLSNITITYKRADSTTGTVIATAGDGINYLANNVPFLAQSYTITTTLSTTKGSLQKWVITTLANAATLPTTPGSTARGSGTTTSSYTFTTTPSTIYDQNDTDYVIRVFAQDDTYADYNLTVSRDAADTDITFTSLAVKYGTTTVTATFDGAEYNVDNVPFKTNTFKVNATLNSSIQLYSIDGGTNKVKTGVDTTSVSFTNEGADGGDASTKQLTVRIYAQDQRVYQDVTLNVKRKEADRNLNLASLTITDNSGTPVGTFNPATQAFTITVSGKLSSLVTSLTATASLPTDSLSQVYMGTKDASGNTKTASAVRLSLPQSFSSATNADDTFEFNIYVMNELGDTSTPIVASFTRAKTDDTNTITVTAEADIAQSTTSSKTLSVSKSGNNYMVRAEYETTYIDFTITCSDPSATDTYIYINGATAPLASPYVHQYTYAITKDEILSQQILVEVYTAAKPYSAVPRVPSATYNIYVNRDQADDDHTFKKLDMTDVSGTVQTKGTDSTASKYTYKGIDISSGPFASGKYKLDMEATSTKSTIYWSDSASNLKQHVYAATDEFDVGLYPTGKTIYVSCYSQYGNHTTIEIYTCTQDSRDPDNKVSNVEILEKPDFEFFATTDTYEVEVPFTVDKVNIKVKKNSLKSTLTYVEDGVTIGGSNQGLNDQYVELKTNTIPSGSTMICTIQLTAENDLGGTKYTFKIKRAAGQTGASLETLEINGIDIYGGTNGNVLEAYTKASTKIDFVMAPTSTSATINFAVSPKATYTLTNVTTTAATTDNPYSFAVASGSYTELEFKIQSEKNSIDSPTTFTTVVVRVFSASKDATLKELDLYKADGTTLATDVNGDLFSYDNTVLDQGTFTAPYKIGDAVVLEAVATDTNAVITGDGNKSLPADGTIKYKVLVTSQYASINTNLSAALKRTLTKEYQLIVKRNKASDVCTLDSLVVKDTAGNVLPFKDAFVSSNGSYKIENLADTITKVNVSYVLTDTNATITGQIGDQELTLPAGSTTAVEQELTLIVKAEDEKTTKKYTIRLSRTVVQLSGVNDIDNIVVTDSKATTYAPYSSATYLYEIEIPATEAGVTFNVTTKSSAATLVDAADTALTNPFVVALDEDETKQITIICKAEDGTPGTPYVYKIHRMVKDTDATLQSLSYNGIAVADFSPTKINYTINLTHEIETFYLEAQATKSTSTISANDAPKTAPINLIDGINGPYQITVVAENTAITKVYTINVIRDASSDLSGLIATDTSGNELVDNNGNKLLQFVSTDTVYAFQVPYENSKIKLEATAEGGNLVTINTTLGGSPVTTTLGVAEITLKEGLNEIIMEVVPASKLNKKQYKINVTRVAGETDNTIKSYQYFKSLEDKTHMDEDYNIVPIYTSLTVNATDTEYSYYVARDITTFEPKIELNSSKATYTLPSNKVINVGQKNVFEVIVKSQTGVDRKYTFNVYNADIDNEILSLKLKKSSGGTELVDADSNKLLEFAKETYTYNITVDYSQKDVYLEALLKSNYATIKYSTNGVNYSDYASQKVELDEGTNKFYFYAISEYGKLVNDGTTGVTKKYAVIIERLEADKDPTLKSLTVTVGGEVKAWDATLDDGQTLGTNGSYTYVIENIGDSVSAINIKAEANKATTVIGGQIGNQTLNDSAASAAGYVFNFTVTSTAEDGSVNTYTITVSRGALDTDSDNTITGITLVDSLGNSYLAFNTETQSYIVNIPYSINGVKVTSYTINATKGATSPATINGAGQTNITSATGFEKTHTVYATSQKGVDGTKYTIKVNVAAANSESRLKELYIDGEKYTKFDSDVYNYIYGTVENSTKKIDVAAVAMDAQAKITGDVGNDLVLSEGPNYFTIVVTAENGTYSQYKVTITRDASTPELTSLGATGIELLDTTDKATTFKSNVTTYHSIVANGIINATITASVENSSYEVTCSNSLPGTTIGTNRSFSVSLKEGENRFEIKVTNLAGKYLIYTYIITRRGQENSNTSITSLKLTGLEDSIEYIGAAEFSDLKNTYSVTVPNKVQNVDLSVQVEDIADAFGPGATVRYINDKNLRAGQNNEVIALVTAEDGTQRTISVNVYRQPYAYDVEIAEIDRFKADYQAHALLAEYTVTSDISALTINVLNQDITDTNVPDYIILKGNTLKVGSNDVKVKILCDDGTYETLEFKVKRADYTFELGIKEISRFKNDYAEDDIQRKYTVDSDIDSLTFEIKDMNENATYTPTVKILSGEKLEAGRRNNVSVQIIGEDGYKSEPIELVIEREAYEFEVAIKEISRFKNDYDNDDLQRKYKVPSDTTKLTFNISDKNTNSDAPTYKIVSGEKLNVGTNNVVVEITGADGYSVTTVEFVVEREEYEFNIAADEIKDLEKDYSDGALKSKYIVPSNVTSINFDITNADENIEEQPTFTVLSGETLKPGDNQVKVQITANDGAVTTETINVYRTPMEFEVKATNGVDEGYTCSPKANSSGVYTIDLGKDGKASDIKDYEKFISFDTATNDLIVTKLTDTSREDCNEVMLQVQTADGAESKIVKIELAATKSPATSFDLYVWIVLGLAIILLIIILICVNRDKYGSVSRKRKAN